MGPECWAPGRRAPGRRAPGRGAAAEGIISIEYDVPATDVKTTTKTLRPLSPDDHKLHATTTAPSGDHDHDYHDSRKWNIL